MLSRVFSATMVGLDPVLIEVEVDVSARSLPSFTIVGLPGKSVEESKERVRSALKNTGCDLPPHRITVNLSPADIPKEGPAFDLAIAVGILVASSQLPQSVQAAMFLGELSLDGSLRSTKGILPATILARDSVQVDCIYLPHVNSSEARVVNHVHAYPARNLLELFHHLSGKTHITPLTHLPFSQISTTSKNSELDFADIRGQHQAKRAAEIAAGNHNLLLVGIPGSGKTMLSRALPSILPSLTAEESLEITRIYSATGELPSDTSLITARPFRSPHHTTSKIGLIGGGSHPRPGEISLAHRGVLFLDELPEFPRDILESLRQPLEDGVVTISRARGSLRFPAKFLLVAAANPCPCGYLGDATRPCVCTPGSILKYHKRLSGPLLDRIDLHITVPPVEIEKLESTNSLEPSRTIRARVQKARNLQLKRFKNFHIFSNSEINSKNMTKFCPLSLPCRDLLRQAHSSYHLSARSHFKIIKIARTIADLSGEKDILSTHIAESLQYRPLESS